ncbi:hypothetical protein DP73_00015 [Desulfosporosinus sp. HMP52]|uniref:hypothetical protein n=1 Tax=Desulfosporosinus sp. HMP52 TaxID=1487923 RepID=UPI00051FBC2A|nr:hypothetical protein [Desulfosporosinus sp. HMP52]KGK91994.1 hypothetical protein DP73_00015 [Desulfosporosinus sp. HMP52]
MGIGIDSEGLLLLCWLPGIVYPEDIESFALLGKLCFDPPELEESFEWVLSPVIGFPIESGI